MRREVGGNRAAQDRVHRLGGQLIPRLGDSLAASHFWGICRLGLSVWVFVCKGGSDPAYWR